MNWDRFDELFQSLSRPWVIVANGTAVAFSAVWSVMYGHEIVLITIGAAAGLAGGAAYLRTVDKQTAAKAATEDKKTDTAAKSLDKQTDAAKE